MRQAAEGVDDRPVGRGAVGEVEAAADQHRGLRAPAGHELGQEPGLPDAGLAGHDHGPAVPCGGAFQGLAEALELLGSPNHLGAGLASGHEPDPPVRLLTTLPSIQALGNPSSEV